MQFITPPASICASSPLNCVTFPRIRTVWFAKLSRVDALTRGVEIDSAILLGVLLDLKVDQGSYVFLCETEIRLWRGVRWVVGDGIRVAEGRGSSEGSKLEDVSQTRKHVMPSTALHLDHIFVSFQSRCKRTTMFIWTSVSIEC